MQKEVMFAGFGGQGILLIGNILAHTAMEEGFEVAWVPSYGPEMRGGTAYCLVVISDRSIGSPIVRNPMHLLSCRQNGSQRLFHCPHKNHHNTEKGPEQAPIHREPGASNHMRDFGPL